MSLTQTLALHVLSAVSVVPKPVLRLDFEGEPAGFEIVGEVSFGNGPRPPEFPDFAKKNRATEFDGSSRLVIQDPGKGSPLDFDNGDAITLEAWVWPGRVGEGNNVYLIGKGRTNNKGYAANNQNYALRLRGQRGEACVSFLFSSRPEEGKPGEWHRWTSISGILPGDGWHHVAACYEFGKPESIKGYLDGKSVPGKWDMGSATKRRPVVDDDELWIGSALGGSRNNSYVGGLDEVAIHREILSPEAMAKRFRQVEQPKPKYVRADWPEDKVLVEVAEGFSPARGWPRPDLPPLDSYQQDVFGFFRTTHKYAKPGLRVDRPKTFLLRSLANLSLPPGEHEWLVRSRWASRLWVNDKLMVSVSQPSKGGGAHHNVPKIPEDWPAYLRLPGPGDAEKRFLLKSDGKPVTVRFEILVGDEKGKQNFRHDLGETCIAVSLSGQPFVLLGSLLQVPLTDAGWMAWRREREPYFRDLDAERRRQVAAKVNPYWEKRHQQAREIVSAQVGPKPPETPDFLPVRNEIDQFIGNGLIQATKRLRRPQEAAGATHFREHVLPLLEERCFKCHRDKKKGDLHMDSREAMLKGGESGEPAVVPGDVGKSLLFTLVASRDEDERMPPKGKPLNAGELKALREWIEQGASWPSDKPSAVAIDDRPVTPKELAAANLLPAPLTNGLAFLRRVTLDLVGVFPSLDEIRAFEADKSPDKRAKVIDRLLDDPRWADNWVGYWQDLLAENPNVVKPKLNNTGPFRDWIYESFLDNKPMDRFATELIMMQGSKLGGGPAGFGMATQNDVPMAAKAHVVGTAFLGVNLQCARCHDAPYHPFKQADLFGMAAMLERKAIKVPKTSSVVISTAGARKPLVEVTLKPGSSVAPAWALATLSKPDALALQQKDSRARLAYLVTSPSNERFAQVTANRLWKRFFGVGLVLSADDWHNLEPSHPELLKYLGRELVLRDYDLKGLVRLILNSHAYQRETSARATPRSPSEKPLFAGQPRRRLRAEQIVDGLYHATGLPMEVGELNMDRDGGLGPDTFLNLGYPRKAWQCAALSNERDRPSLAIPRVQAVIDTLKQFGWRPSRQDPLTDREEAPHALQSGILSNGILATWLTRLSPEHGITTECLEERSADDLLEAVFLRLLTRRPTGEERDRFLALLGQGYSQRIIPVAERKPIPWPKKIPAVSWSNHLSPEANMIVIELEKRAREGDPPSNALNTAWRERMEDTLWALINSPELLFVP
ncbi:MAG: DUF1553 domain-containing protein [Opitutales bacterium]